MNEVYTDAENTNVLTTQHITTFSTMPVMPIVGRVYLAGPITGQSYEGCTNWREFAEIWLGNIGIMAKSPLRGKEFLAQEESIKDHYIHNPMGTIEFINNRDYYDVQKADVVLAVFKGATRVSIGTVMEIAWARAMQKPVVIVMDDAGLHNHGMLTYGNIVVDDINKALEIVAEIIT